MSKIKPETFTASRAITGNPYEMLLDDVPDIGGERITFEDRQADNETRAGWALEALRTFGVQTGVHAESPVTALGDLLCNFRHLCDALGIDYDHANLLGAYHYEGEIRGDL